MRLERFTPARRATKTIATVVAVDSGTPLYTVTRDSYAQMRDAHDF